MRAHLAQGARRQARRPNRSHLPGTAEPPACPAPAPCLQSRRVTDVEQHAADSSAVRTSLVGRDAELRSLLALIEHPDRGGVAIVHGPAGIGKSSLLAAAREHALGRRFTAPATAGVQSEASLPYAALERLLRGLLDRVDALPSPQRAALLSGLGMADGRVTDRFLIGLATLNLLADAASETRLVAFVDDAQWLDPATADVLAFVARRVQAEPIALVVARSDGGGSEALSVAALEDAVDVALAPLDEVHARALLARTDGALSGPARRRLLQLAGGNPLALVELPRVSDASGDGRDAIPPLTERLERSFSIQLLDLPATTRTLVLVAAADDGDAAVEILAAARRIAPDAGEADVDAAVGARVLDRDGTRLRFRHPLIRSACHQAASERERRDAHAAIAGVLADEPHRRAWHLAAASEGPDEDVAAALTAAAGDARQRGAVATAARALRRASELSVTRERAIQRLLDAGELSVELGDVDAVAVAVARVETLRPGELARARIRWLREIFAEDASQDLGPARSLLADARRARMAGDADLALKLLLAAGTRCWWALPADAPVRDEIVGEALGIGVPGDDPRVLAVIAATSAVRHAATVIGPLERACARAREDAHGTHLLGQAAHMVGESALAVRQLARVEAQWRAQGRLALLAQGLVMRAWSSIQLGNWPAVEPAAAEGDRLARETRQPLWAAGARAALAAVAGVRGELDRAMAMAADVEAQLTGARPTNLFAVLQVARGVTALAGGRHAEAFDHLARMFDPADPAHHYAERHGGLSYLAEAAVHCGRVPEARAVIDAVRPLLATSPATLLEIGVTVAMPLVAAPEDAERAFAAALAGNVGLMPFHRARLLLAQGSWLRRQRRAAESRAPLRTARDAFDALGAVPWAERARQELRASGERSSRRAPEGRDRLTPQELQIAQLAADGLSNPEIGERLFLSARTVASHLYRAFPKLGVASRAELAGALRGGDDSVR
jgi:DNA-binding NarL/FixJ family response regulator